MSISRPKMPSYTRTALLTPEPECRPYYARCGTLHDSSQVLHLMPDTSSGGQTLDGGGSNLSVSPSPPPVALEDTGHSTPTTPSQNQPHGARSFDLPLRADSVPAARHEHGGQAPPDGTRDGRHTWVSSPSNPDRGAHASIYPYDKGFFQSHFDLFYAWECPPFSMLSKEAFESDLHAGRDRYCSPALLAAVVCLASQFHDGSAWPACSCDGDSYFKEAKRFLQENAGAARLPNFQALGLLALREVRNGNKEEARELIEESVGGITALRREKEEAAENFSQEHHAVVDMAFCGAVSLSRYGLSSHSLYYQLGA
jgi:hypothetical protein